METCYRLPITSEYTTRGCTVKIDAAANSDCVDVFVKNNKTNFGSSFRYIIMPNSSNGYRDEDIKGIKNMLNDLLDQYGDPECNEIHFTNQILS